MNLGVGGAASKAAGKHHQPNLPAVAALQPPLAMLSSAMWVPTRDEEHAVSTATEGPLKPYW